MNFNYSILLVFGLFLPGRVWSQTDTLQKAFRFDITAGFYHQKSFTSGNDPREINLPSYLSQRRPQEPTLANTWDLNNNLATDNPLGHGASFFRFHAWYNITSDISLYGSLEVTNGGFSWGPYNTFNTAILPRYWGTYNKAFHIGSSPFKFYAKIGNFENFKSYEGLTMYNIDMQGVVANLQYRKLHFTSTSVTDLQKSLGLNIDGTRNYKVSVEDVHIGKNWKTDIQAGVQQLLSTSTGSYMNMISAAIYQGPFRMYTEASYRYNDLFDPSLNSAFLCGIKGSSKLSKIQMKYSLEYRYYGGGFNYGFRKEENTHYRKIDKGAGGNFVGDQVYPISYLNRPFSQWAVFTEYNNKRWVEGITLNAQIDYPISTKLKWIIDLDMNIIATEKEQPFLYPFYKTGLKATAYKGTYVAVTLTNKTMNLDNFYTSYYCLKHPAFQFELRRDIKL
jgi:hypothetical protein